MPKLVRYTFIAIAVIGLVVAAIAIIAPRAFRMETIKEQIEAKVVTATGLRFTMGDTVKPSFFPWVGIGLKSLKLGNPAGFAAENFATIEEFEIRVKLLPLLKRQVQIKRFNIKGATLILEKNESGRGNWEGIGDKNTTTGSQPPAGPGKSQEGLPFDSFQTDKLTIKQARILYVDHGASRQIEIDQLSLTLDGFTLYEPFTVQLSALVDKHPLTVQAVIGPIGARPGKAPIDFALATRFSEHLSGDCKGRLLDLSAQKFDAAVQISAFSPRAFLAGLNQHLPWTPVDPAVLEHLRANFNLSGSPNALAISDGSLELDDSRLDFSGHIADLARPIVELSLKLDHLDLDRYLPVKTPPSKVEQRPTNATTVRNTADNVPDYAPLRKPLLDVSLQAASLKVHNIQTRQVKLRLAAKEGVIRVDPLEATLFEGHLKAAVELDLRLNRPHTFIDLDLFGVQAGPMLRQLLEKEILEGLLAAKVQARFNGDTLPLIRRTISGHGSLNLSDGAIVGIDLTDMVSNVESAFGLASNPTVTPRTAFSELSVPFTLNNGLAGIAGARLIAPQLHVTANGTANLVTEALDLQIRPVFVASLAGRSSTVTVPVLVGGTFSKPTFRPDLEGILKQKLKDPRVIQKIVPDGIARDILKALPFSSRP